MDAWYDECGAGDPVVLLHPGGVDSRVFEPNRRALSERFRVYTPERRGHGHTPDVPGPITFDLMAADTIAFLESVIRGPAALVGCSDGAIVALHVALARPDLVSRLVCVCGVFHKDGWLPGVLSPGSEPPEFLVNMYGEVSPDGPEHYATVWAKLEEMHATGPTLTPADLARVRARTLVMVGDDDEMPLSHSAEFANSIPAGELAVVPGTSHGLLVEKPELCNRLLLDFLTTDAVETFAPIRRRT